MPISGYFDVPFASSGTVTTVPDAIQSSGSVSYTSGWGVDYTLAASNPSYKYIDQGSMNQIFYDITSAIQKIQQGSAPAFITSTMNGGTPYTYPLYATVSYGGVTYISNTAGNTDTPPSSKWNVFPITGSNLFIAGTSTGIANAQVLASLSPASGFSLSNPGDTITFTIGFTNTTAATMAVTTPAISPTAIQKNSGSGLVALTGGEMVAGNIATLTVSASGTLVLDAGLPATLFLQKTNNLSELTASASTARSNISAAQSGANTDITSLQGSALIIPSSLGVGSLIRAFLNTGSISANGTIAATGITPQAEFGGTGPTNVGCSTVGVDTITGTWKAMQSASGTLPLIIWQRTL